MSSNDEREGGRLRRALRRHPYVIGILALVVLWLLCSYLGLVGRTLLASPSEVLRVLIRALEPGASEGERIFLHAGGTIGRALSGWLLAVGLGVLIGLAIGARSLLHVGSEPILELARAIPPIMVFPLLLVAFNFGGAAYVWTIVYGCTPVMVLTVARGTQRISREKVAILTVFEVGKGVRLLTAVMEVFPSCFLGARITFSLSLVIAVVTEMVFAPRSGIALGALAKDAEISFDTPVFYATVVVIGAFGYAANALMRSVEERLGVGATDLGT